MNEDAEYMFELLKEFRDLWIMKGLQDFSQVNANHITAKGLEELRIKVDELEMRLRSTLPLHD